MLLIIFNRITIWSLCFLIIIKRIVRQFLKFNTSITAGRLFNRIPVRSQSLRIYFLYNKRRISQSFSYIVNFFDRNGIRTSGNIRICSFIFHFCLCFCRFLNFSMKYCFIRNFIFRSISLTCSYQRCSINNF